VRERNTFVANLPFQWIFMYIYWNEKR